MFLIVVRNSFNLPGVGNDCLGLGIGHEECCSAELENPKICQSHTLAFFTWRWVGGGWLVGWCSCVCSFLPFLFFLFFTVVVFMPPLICFFNNSVPPPLAASTLRNTGASQKNAGINHQIRSWHHDVYVNVKGICNTVVTHVQLFNCS